MASLLSNSIYLRSHSAIEGKHANVAMMTSGGLAPCLSSSIAQLSKYWIQSLREGKISGLTLRMYVDGYKGVLTGDSFVVPESEWDSLEMLNHIGGSPIGNSRVKVRHKRKRLNGLVGGRRGAPRSKMQDSRRNNEDSKKTLNLTPLLSLLAILLLRQTNNVYVSNPNKNTTTTPFRSVFLFLF